MLPEALRVRMKRIIHECKISKTIQLQFARYTRILNFVQIVLISRRSSVIRQMF